MALGVYLGNPSGPFGMTLLPMLPPGGVIDSSLGIGTSLGRVAATQTLISGGTTSQRLPYTKRAYSLAWSILIGSEIDSINSFFDGRQGSGPYCLVDPSWANHLPANVASVGAVLGSLPEWSPTAGTFTTTTATAPPTGKLSGVGSWASAGSGAILYMGLNNVVDGTWLPPVVAGLSHRCSIWARTLTGTATVTPALMYGVAGSAPAGTAATGSAGSLTTTWQQLTVPVASSFSWPTTADYAMLKLTCSTAAAPNLLFAAAEFVYDTVATVAVLSPWTSGLGVPRLNVVGSAPTPVDLVGWREYTLTLAEA